MTLNELLDLAKKTASIKSDRQLANALDVTDLSRYRKRGSSPSDETCTKLADLCNMRAEEVIAICHIQKAESPAVKKTWQNILKAVQLASFGLALVATGFINSPSAEASTNKQTSHIIILCDIIKMLIMRLIFSIGIIPYYEKTTIKARVC